MSDWTSVSLKEETKETLDEQRGDRSWGEFLQTIAQERDETPEMTDFKGYPVDDEVVEKLDEMLEILKNMDVMQHQRTLINKLDDHDTDMKTFIKRELGR